MAKIVIDARESGTSTGRYVDKLVENIHKLKPEFEIVVLIKSPRLEFMKSITPKFVVVESNFEEDTFSEQFGLRKQISELHADLVHFTMPQQPVLYRGKTVTTIHDLTTTRFRNPAKNPILFSAKQIVYKWLIKRVSRKSVAVITPSQFVKHDVAQYAKIDPNKIIVTLEAADPIKQTPEPISELMHEKFLLYVGRPLPHKNLKRLMEAYSIIRNTRNGVRLVMAGRRDKLYEQHEDWARKEHIEGLYFAGLVSEGQLRWLYEHCAAYVFPSLSEGFGLPGLEAMVHGAPVISSNATCLPEIYGEAAEYFNPTSVQEMVNAIGAVLQNPARAQELRQLGRLQVKKYSWQKMAQETLDVYEKALSS